MSTYVWTIPVSKNKWDTCLPLKSPRNDKIWTAQNASLANKADLNLIFARFPSCCRFNLLYYLSFLSEKWQIHDQTKTEKKHRCDSQSRSWSGTSRFPLVLITSISFSNGKNICRFPMKIAINFHHLDTPIHWKPNHSTFFQFAYLKTGSLTKKFYP